VRHRILPRLSLDLLGIGFFEESCQFGAKLGEMIKQLRIRKIVRSRNVWVPIDCSDPGLENLLTVGEHKVAKTGDCSDLKLPLTVPSDERDPPNLISEVNTFAALGERIIAPKNSKRKDGILRLCGGDGEDPQCASVLSSSFCCSGE
jgi:hypothetical protein